MPEFLEVSALSKNVMLGNTRFRQNHGQNPAYCRATALFIHTSIEKRLGAAQP
jgi:hypothetical protein